VSQAVECLPSKHKALSSNLELPKKDKRKKERKNKENSA
jgi:hypothetical protein